MHPNVRIWNYTNLDCRKEAKIGFLGMAQPIKKRIFLFFWDSSPNIPILLMVKKFVTHFSKKKNLP
jgi:hypothetical protein